MSEYDEDCQDEHGFLDEEEIETITLTFRDDSTQIIEEMEFDVIAPDGVRFHIWMLVNGIGSA